MDQDSVDDIQAFHSQEASLADERCRQRLKEDLGLEDEAIEVIMNLRSQVKTLQTRLRQVELTVQVLQTSQGARLIRYRQETYEADWEEL